MGGGGGLTSAPDWSIEGEEAGESLGAALSGTGDIDGDGLGGALIGAPGWSGGTSGQGRVLYVAGAVGGLSADVAASAEGGSPGAALGSSVAALYDVDGDGFGDVAAGAPVAPGGGIARGEVRVWFGGAGPPLGGRSAVLQGVAEDGRFGAAVAGLGSGNGDVYADVLVGAPMEDGDQGEDGVVRGFLGHAGGLLTTASWTFEGARPGAECGSALAGAGDVDGDGLADALIGAREDWGTAVYEGRVRLFRGSATTLLEAAPAWEVAGGGANAHLGETVAAAGDVDGDGFDDLLGGGAGAGAGLDDVVGGAPDRAGPGGAGAGVARWFRGGPRLPEAAIWSVAGSTAFGVGLAALGDVNGDGFDDLAVRSGYFESGGAVYAFEGGAGGLATAATDVVGGAGTGAPAPAVRT